MAVYTYKNVLQRIADLTSLVDISSHEERLKRLIYKAAIDSFSAVNLITKNNTVIEVIEGLAEKPCDLLRLLRVYAVNGVPQHESDYRLGTHMEPTRLQKGWTYDHNARYIKPSWVRNGHVAISYYAIPTVELEDGEEAVMISYEQLDYCAYKAASILMRDEAGKGTINYNIYLEFKDEAEGQMHVALSSMRKVSIDQMESQSWFMRNAQFFNPR